MKSLDASVLDQLLDPVGRLLPPEVARKFVHHRFDSKAQAHIDKLARKCNEGRLTDDERREYETYVHAIDFLAILQAKARALLRRSGDGRLAGPFANRSATGPGVGANTATCPTSPPPRLTSTSSTSSPSNTAARTRPTTTAGAVTTATSTRARI
jgi:hypothetical protein